MKKTSVCVLALVAAVAGCSSIESGDLETSGMTAIISATVRDDSSATDVVASLGAGALTSVDLDGEDILSASADDVSVELEESNLLGVFTYNGVLEGIAEPGTEVTVSLARSADKTPAPSSTVRLPVAVFLTSPAAGTAFSRENDDIVVEINSGASDDDMRLNWSGDCVKNDGVDVPAGQVSVTINRGTIIKRAQVDENDPDSQPVPDTCTMTLTIERVVEGVLDPAWGGGSITSVSQDSRDVTSNL